MEVPLFDIGIDDTPYPFLLFVSQAETEATLCRHLTDRRLVVERGADQADAAGLHGYLGRWLPERAG